jgi:hypothetical protein
MFLFEEALNVVEQWNPFFVVLIVPSFAIFYFIRAAMKREITVWQVLKEYACLLPACFTVLALYAYRDHITAATMVVALAITGFLVLCWQCRPSQFPRPMQKETQHTVSVPSRFQQDDRLREIALRNDPPLVPVKPWVPPSEEEKRRFREENGYVYRPQHDPSTGIQAVSETEVKRKRGRPKKNPEVAAQPTSPEPTVHQIHKKTVCLNPRITFPPILLREFRISYTDAKGKFWDERDIKIMSIEKKEDDRYMLKCFCFVRERMRYFRSDRIGNMMDIETGEIIEDATACAAFHCRG